MTLVDVPTTKRKPLTKRQRTKLGEDNGWLCCICGLPVDPRKPWVDEHKRALGLGGSNDMSNRGPAHMQCAAVKTLEKDMPAIVKAKRQKDMQTSRDPSAKPQIQSRGFETQAKKPKIEKQPLSSLGPPAWARRFTNDRH